MLGVTRPRGYTLLELMVTLAIVAILAAVAAPSFNATIERQRVRSAADDLVNTFNYARSEAVKRNQDAVITANSNSTDWSSGWAVSVGGTVLRRHDAVSGSTITAPGSSLTYDSNGRTTGGSGDFEVKPSSGDTSHARCVNISLSGRPANKEGVCS